MQLSPQSNRKPPRVLFVVPNYSSRIAMMAQTTTGPPLGLASIAAVLLERGAEAAILDANVEHLTDRQTVDRIIRTRPDVIGFTAVTPTVNQCGLLAAQVKSALPSSMVVLGGIHPTVLPEKTLASFPAVDLIVRGEADTLFPDVLDGLRTGKTPAEFNGLTFRDGEDQIVHTPPPTGLVDLDALPFPARQLLPMERYISPDGERFTTILGGRGCPGHCSYCSVNLAFGGKLRQRHPNRVVEEMIDCHTRFHAKVFGFIDDTFTADAQWVNELCAAMVSAGLPRKIRWFCLTRVDKVTPDLLSAMQAAGCFRLEFGIESGDPEVLDFLGKGTTPEQILQAFSWARALDLETMAFIMLFSPAETPRSLAATKKLLFQADPDLLQVSFCTPYPGTRLAEDCRRRGLDLSEEWDRYIFLKKPVLRHPLFSESQMIGWQMRLLRSFYFRPRTVLRIIRIAVRSGSWRAFFRSAWAALRSLTGQ